MREQGYIKALLEKYSSMGTETALHIYRNDCLEEISYKKLVEDILKISGYFYKNEIYRENIAIISENSYEWLVVFFAIISTGNIAVLLDPLLPEYLLKEKCDMADVLRIYGNPNNFPDLSNNVSFLNMESLDNMEPISEKEIYCEKAHDTILMLGTSGTMGKSKFVEISSRNLEYSVLIAEENCFVEGCEKTQFTFPLHHIAGIKSIIAALYWGKQMCIGRGMRFLFADMAIFNPTGVTMVPLMMESLKKILISAKTDNEKKHYIGDRLHRIFVAGASSKDTVCRFFLENGFILDTAYGMTETTGVTTWCKLNIENIGTIGKLQGEIACKIVDGELLFKGPVVMKGYYKDQEETDKIIKDGWIHSGDMGYCDENGFYYITGRKKNVIILSNGENVNPEEIENDFYVCDSIVESMVYSDGRGICADIYASDNELASSYIKKYNQNLPLYRQVYKVNYMEHPLEKTSTGKIKRKENVYGK